MATTPTSIGPIGARQINQSLYVGHSDLTTIQSAVTAAASIGGQFVIVIPFDYAGSDTIAAVTGGSSSIEILDQRLSQTQTYIWSGTAYGPADFIQQKGYVTSGMPAIPPASALVLGFDPPGTLGAGTARLDVCANPGMGMPAFQLTGIPSNGTASQAFLRTEVSGVGNYPAAGLPQIEMPVQLGLFNEGFNNYNLWTGGGYITGGQGMTVWAKAAENAIDLQGLTIGGAYDQTIRLNLLGGGVQIGPITFDGAGNIVGVTGMLGVTSIGAVNFISSGVVMANDIQATTCEVDSSPVRTFANTPDGPGQGMVWPTEGIAVSLGSTWQNPSINPASLATWPAAGIPVSTGSAWGTSLAPGSLATYPAAGIAVSTGSAWALSLSPTSVATWPAAGIPVSTGSAWTTPIDPTTVVVVNAQGHAQISGTFTAGTAFSLLPTSAAPTMSIQSQATPYQVALFGSISTTTGILGGYQFDGYTSDFSSGTTWLRMSQLTGQSPAIAFNGNMTVNGNIGATGDLTGGNNGMKIHWDGSSGYIDCGLNLLINAINATPNFGLIVTGNLIADGTKNFRITHPLDETKHLTHACLEGPENGLYYRGESVTEGGWAEIILPHYFEAIVKPDERTVLLTPIFEEEDEPIGKLAASRVKEGKFRVWSEAVSQKFCWEVIAVRGDVPPLEVETYKGDANDFRGDRAGASEDGKSDPADDVPATANPTATKRTRRNDPKT
jgi:hypothetical protein